MGSVQIVHYIGSLSSHVGGPARFILDAARVLADHGVRSTILTHQPSDEIDARSTASDAITTVLLDPISAASKRFPPTARQHIRRELRKADVAHVHCIWGIGDLQVATAAKRLRTPYVLSLHGMLDEWSLKQRALKKQVYLWLVANQLLTDAARIHCTATGELEQSAMHFDRAKADVVPPIIDLEPYRSLQGPELVRARFEYLNDGRPVVLYLSRVHYKKRPEAVIDAAATLKADGIFAHFIIAGTGETDYLDSLRAYAAMRGVADRVHFPGPVLGPDKFSLYQAATLFALPTRQENFGLVLIEAMACGTPVVTTKGTDIWPDLQFSGGALIVDPDSPEFTDALRLLLTNQSTRDAMGAVARKWALRTYSEHVVAAQFISMYNKACGSTLVSRNSESPSLQQRFLDRSSGSF